MTTFERLKKATAPESYKTYQGNISLFHKTSQTPVSIKSFQPTTGHHGNTEEKQEQRKKAVTHSGGEGGYFYSTDMLQHLPPESAYTNQIHQQLQEQVLTHEGATSGQPVQSTPGNRDRTMERERSLPMKKQRAQVPPMQGGGGGHNSQAWPGLTWWAPLQD